MLNTANLVIDQSCAVMDPALGNKTYAAVILSHIPALDIMASIGRYTGTFPLMMRCVVLGPAMEEMVVCSCGQGHRAKVIVRFRFAG